MSLKLAATVGVSLIILPSIALALSPTTALTSRPKPASALMLAQAQSDPVRAHATIEWAKARLSEIDATIKTLEQDASKLSGDARKRADETLQKLRATREAYRAKIEGALADGRQQTEAQIVETRAALEARWNEFEHDLEGYLATINSEVAVRNAVFQARVKAEELYWQQTIAELKRSVTTVAAAQRAAIEARIAQVQIDADSAKARLAKLQQAGGEAWSALRDGLSDSRRAFDKAQEAVRTAIERARQ